MKAVVIGDANSVYIKDHIKDVCKDTFSEIILLSGSNVDDSFYSDLGVTLVNTEPWKKDSGSSETISIEEKTYLWDSICSKIDDIDVLQVHFCAGGSHMYCYKKLASKSVKKYMVYWGSDLMRADQKNIDLNLEAIRMSDKVICLTKSLEISLKDRYKDIDINKVRVLDFGVVYEDIELMSTQLSNADCKISCGFPTDRLSVMIGYNGAVQQQHIKVLEALSKMENSVKDRLFLFFPMSYGRNAEYRTEVENEAKRSGIPYQFIDSFLTREQLVKMRLATDIFIHSQLTDALSGSLCEVLFAGASVINPGWIFYPELKEKGIEYFEYERFEEILSLIDKSILQIDENKKQDILEIRRKMKEINDRNAMIGLWKKLFNTGSID